MKRPKNPSDLLRQARSSMSAKRVYAKPVTSGGVTVIPAARVMGGAGGGNNDGPSGEGAGFGVAARPVGAFVIKDGQVRWEPAIDATRLGLRGMLVPIVGMLVARSIVKTLAKRHR